MDAVPPTIPDPTNYYRGIDPSNRVICRNVIVFERLSRQALQQKHLANRMHHRYVLIRALETLGIVSVDGHSVQLDEGDALLVAPYQFHHFIDLHSDCLRWLFITFDLVEGESSLAVLNYQRLQPDSMAQFFWAEIVKLWSNDSATTRAELLPVLDRLLMRLPSTTMGTRKVNASGLNSNNEWIAQIESLVIQSVREGWTLEEVANRASLSERHLRSRFQQQMGLSLKDYRSNYQFHMAISLMRDSNRSLSEVAELCGFNSQSVFTRFIRRMVDRTPRELSQQIRGGRFVPS